MALGRTHHNWRPDVHRVVNKIHRAFPRTRCNTYENHPWPGWDGRSIDVWSLGGRGDPLGRLAAKQVRDFVFHLPGDPQIRHYIVFHELWTSFGGSSFWEPDDHSGRLRHFHVTFW